MISPDTVYLHVTRTCNLRCSYCYFDAGRPMNGELDAYEMRVLLKEIHQLGPGKVVFTGGEPLLRKDIIELAQEFKTHNRQSFLCLITNGTLISEDNVADLVNQFDEIRISIDGFEDINDLLRGKGTYEKALRGLFLIMDRGGNPVASITLTSYSSGYLKEFLLFLMKNKISKIHLSPVKLAGRATDSRILCDVGEIEGIVENCWDEVFGIKIEHQQSALLNCGAGTFLNIYPDGSVFPCHMLSFPEFYVGNVRQEKLTYLYHDSLLINKLRCFDFSGLSDRQSCFKRISKNRICLGVHVQNQIYRKELMTLLSSPMQS